MKRLLIASLCGLLAIPAPAQVGGVFVCPTCSQETSTLAHIAKTIAHIQIALQTYQQIMLAGQILNNMQWSDFQTDMANLAGVIQIGQGLAYTASDIDAQFQQKYPGFQSPTMAYLDQFQIWSGAALDTIRGTLRGMNGVYNQLLMEQFHMNYLQMQNNSAVGEMQAIQTGVQVSVETLKSLSKLRQVIMMDAQARAVFQAYQLQKDMQQVNLEQNFFVGTAGRDGIGW